MALEKDRNALAHGVFGICLKIPDGLIWTETTHFIHFSTQVALQGRQDNITEDFYKKCYVYEPGDLETIAQEFENLHVQLTYFIGYLSSEDLAFRQQRYQQLVSETRVAKEINRIITRRAPDDETSPE